MAQCVPAMDESLVTREQPTGAPGDPAALSAIKFDEGFQAGEPAALFRLRSPIGTLPAQASGFDVAHDGQHFVIAVTDSADSPPLMMVMNWQAGLKK